MGVTLPASYETNDEWCVATPVAPLPRAVAAPFVFFAFCA